MAAHQLSLLALLALAGGCGSGTTPAGIQPDGVPAGQTGIEGVAHRSPIRPVCQLDEPCRAPFSARFEVRQGARVVAHFQSDSSGHFLVHLAPGTYTVVPDASAPLLSRGQAQEVIVQPGGLTHVEFDFDTGIR